MATHHSFHRPSTFVRQPQFFLLVGTDPTIATRFGRFAEYVGLEMHRVTRMERLIESLETQSQPQYLVLEREFVEPRIDAVENMLAALPLRAPLLLVSSPERDRCQMRLAHTLMDVSMSDEGLCNALSEARECLPLLDVQLTSIDCHNRYQELNDRERLVADLAADGTPNKAIARRIDKSIKTIERTRQDVNRSMKALCPADLASRILLARLHPFLVQGQARIEPDTTE